MRYLVTGGAGFIGSHLLDALIAAGNEVVVLDNFSSGKRDNIPHHPAVTVIEGSICNAQAVRTSAEGCNGVFHLAAIPSVTQSVDEWAATHRVNQSGAVEVFEVAASLGIPVVYASSAAVFGDNPALPLSENSETAPLSPYGLDKLACEWQAKIGGSLCGLSSVGLRFFNVYGPRQDPKSPYSGVISIFMQRCKQEKPLTIYGDGLQTRDFIYVGDVVAHLLAAMRYAEQGEAVTEVFNVCTGMPASVKELAGMLASISRNPHAIEYVDARAGDIRFSCGNPEKALKQLGLSAKTLLAEGLGITWRHFSE